MVDFEETIDRKDWLSSYIDFIGTLEVFLKVDSIFIDDLLVQVELHQGSALSLLLIIVLVALSREIWPRCPEELLYANDVTVVNETLQGFKRRLEAWKGALKLKRLRVNFKKTKKTISSKNAGKVTGKSKFSCAVCRMGVGNIFILCQF